MWHLISPPTLGADSIRQGVNGTENARAVLFDIGATTWSGLLRKIAPMALGGLPEHMQQPALSLRT